MQLLNLHKKFDYFFLIAPAEPNMPQHFATGWLNARNMLRPTMFRYDALQYCDSFGDFARGFIQEII